MENGKTTPAGMDGAVPREPPREVDHTEWIKSQVLAKIGRPPRLDRVEVCRHHNGKYRVNIWQHPDSDKSIAVTPGSRIGLSYYLSVSGKGEILNSNPPLTKLGFSA